jgi:mono/diheme cytochrome c family protein
MNILRPSTRAIALAVAALIFAPLITWAADVDVFEFIPAGGRTLMAAALAGKPPADEVRALVTGKRSREEWLKYLRQHSQSITGLQRLKEKELLTLADYLSFNMPLPAAQIPANLAQANWGKVLPPDGRDFALNYCQSCHIITVVVTQDRTRDAWLGSLGKPSHVQIKLNREQREALVGYLVLNAAIPIDDVPEELRAGGATY